jgi:hypothetical protein
MQTLPLIVSVSLESRRPAKDMERNAPSFVIQVTNGTGSVRQFASKAARCKARAAFELSASAAAVWPRQPGAWITAWPRLKWQRRAG